MLRRRAAAQVAHEGLEGVGVRGDRPGVLADVAVVVAAVVEQVQWRRAVGQADERGDQHRHGGVVGIGHEAGRTAHAPGIVDVLGPLTDSGKSGGGQVGACQRGGDPQPFDHAQGRGLGEEAVVAPRHRGEVGDGLSGGGG